MFNVATFFRSCEFFYKSSDFAEKPVAALEPYEASQVIYTTCYCVVRLRSTKEQKTRLQCLASAMPKFVIPAEAKKR